MLNQLFSGTPTSPRQVTLPLAANLQAGDPILIGTEPAFLLDDYQANVSGCTAYFNGTFFANVTGETQASPQVGSAVKPGDNLYAVGGTLDATTNVRYGFTLSKDSGGIPFGQLDPSPQAGGPVPSTTTALVGVKI